MHNFGIFKQSIQLSWANIKSNKMRTFLTTLGIIIGVTAVIAMITIVNGAIESVMSEFSSLGAGTLSVSAYGTPLKKGLTENDIEAIRKLDNIAGLTPKISISTAASREKKVLKKTSLTGVSEDYYKQNSSLVTYGRGISDTDVKNETYVCVIDQDMADSLFPGEDPLGEKITLSGVSFTIIGLEGKSDDLFSAFSGMNSSIDGTATIPYSVAKKITGENKVTTVEIYIENTDYTEKLTKDVESVLYNCFNQRDNVYSVFSMDSLLDSMNKMFNTMTYMLAGIASIALLVGGIGIMNMMLVSVSERTKEIGLRKAMGATPGRIQLQFLIEAIVLSVIGGLVGVALGISISYVVAHFMDTPFLFSAKAVMLGVGFSTAVGIIFGWVPAKKASQLSPIDALRSE